MNINVKFQIETDFGIVNINEFWIKNGFYSIKYCVRIENVAYIGSHFFDGDNKDEEIFRVCRSDGCLKISQQRKNEIKECIINNLSKIRDGAILQIENEIENISNEIEPLKKKLEQKIITVEQLKAELITLK